MKRAHAVAAAGAALAAVTLAGWLLWPEPRLPPVPDKDGFLWTRIEVSAKDTPILINVPPSPPGRPAAGPQLYPSTSDWIGPRSKAKFSANGAQLQIDIVEPASRDNNHNRLVYDVERRELLRAEEHVVDEAAPTPDHAVDAGAGDAGPGPRERFVNGALAIDDSAPIPLPSKLEATAWSPDHTKLAVLLADAVLVWQKDRGLTRLGGEPSRVRNGVCSPDGGRIVTGGLRIVDLVNGTVLPLRAGEYETYLLSRQASWRHGGAEVALGIEPRLHRFDTATGLPLAPPRRPPPDHESWTVRAVDGDYAFAKYIPYGQVYDVFHVESGQRLLELDSVFSHSEGSATEASVAVSGDGRRLVTWMYGRFDVRELPERRVWSVSTPPQNNELQVIGSRMVAASRDTLQIWDLDKRVRTAYFKVPESEASIFRSAVSLGGDRLLLPSGRIASLRDGKILSDGPAGVGRTGPRYFGGGWGEGDGFVVLLEGETIVLNRPSDGSTILLYQLVVGSGVELLAMTPDGRFDGSDALLETLWFQVDGAPRRASSLGASRSKGLLQRFHAGTLKQ